MTEIFVPSDLKTRFAGFGRAAALVTSLGEQLDRIGAMNKDAAGIDDDIANAYHGQVTKPTQDLSTLVHNISVALGLTGDSGEIVTTQFEHGEEHAGGSARKF
jgi:hypothetical protein